MKGSSQLIFLFLIFGLICCSSKQNDSSDPIKFRQYYIKGETLYLKHCSSCHQVQGTGLGLLYPPLAKSDFMRTKTQDVVCLIRYGKKGELIVNGKNYNQPMPSFPALSDIEIAEITTYIYNSWGNEQGLFEVKKVSEILKQCNEE